MKLSNLWKAWASTLLSAVIGALIAVLPTFVDGKFDWKALSAGIVVALIGALTDILKELKKGLDEPKKDNK